MVEDEKEKNQDDLIGELAPALHQESLSDFPSTMQTIFLG